MATFIIGVKARITVYGTIEIEAANRDAATELAEQRINDGEIESHDVEWDYTIHEQIADADMEVDV